MICNDFIHIFAANCPIGGFGILMEAGPTQLIFSAVQQEAAVGIKLHLADAEGLVDSVEDGPILGAKLELQSVQIGIFKSIPQAR